MQHLKLVLMSATLKADDFATYFGSVNGVNALKLVFVPGRMLRNSPVVGMAKPSRRQESFICPKGIPPVGVSIDNPEPIPPGKLSCLQGKGLGNQG